MPSPRAAPPDDQRPPRWVRFGILRRYLRGLDHIGLVSALFAALSSLTPSLLPRSWWAQGLVTGLSATGAYTGGVVLTTLLRWAGVPSPPPRVGRAIRRVLVVLAVVALAVMAFLGSAWQNDVRIAVDMPPQGR